MTMRCLVLLWRLTRREGIGLFDLLGFERARLGREVLLAFALIPVALVFILGGIYAAGWLVYGTLTPPYLYGALAVAGGDLWRTGVAVRLGGDRADDL